MTEERRYRDDEIAEIFEAAATAHDPGQRSLAPADGLTLTELQAIGREVGLAPERIADAATAINRRRSTLPRRTDLGMPVSVSRSVDLPRAPTDREWSLLVAEMRETFNARGKDRSSGDLREWAVGNLHAYVEPTEDGYRFRLRTTKGNALALNRVGVAGMVMGLIMLVVLFLQGALAQELFLPALLGLMGAAAVASNAVRLPGWAQEREQQMEFIAARAVALIRPVPVPHGGASET
ncbi:MAG: hypothetical protein AB1941_02625 [Gemmatimonadota bacterium]